MITCAVGAIERIRIDASDSGHARHAAVHQDDIRRRIPDHVDGARPVGGLANDVESTLLEQLVEPGAKQRVYADLFRSPGVMRGVLDPLRSCPC
jgi:hypothetical protein